MSEARTTTDHDEIRAWAEARDGHPAMVDTKARGGIPRIDFGDPEEGLEQIDWEMFFRIFEDNKLAFLYQDEVKGGGTSRFNKFVER